MNHKTHSEISGHAKELINSLSNPNLAARHTQIAEKAIAQSIAFGLELAIEAFRTYLPTIISNPSPMFDEIAGRRIELREFIKKL